jgi:nicotinamidase/pyrazinamidase
MKKIILTIFSILVLIVLILIGNLMYFNHVATQVTQGEPIARMDTIRQALLVIDVQEGTTGIAAMEEYYPQKSEALIQNINLLTDSVTHHQIPVIYIKNEITNFLLNILNDTYAPDNPGSKLDKRLNVVSDMVLNKDKSDAFSNPALDNILTHHKINKLVITGLDLGHCVDKTIRAAENRKYEICIISDAVLAKSDSLRTIQLEAFRQKGHQVLTSKEFIENINF